MPYGAFTFWMWTQEHPAILNYKNPFRQLNWQRWEGDCDYVDVEVKLLALEWANVEVAAEKCLDFYKLRPETRKQTFTQENCKHRGCDCDTGRGRGGCNSANLYLEQHRFICNSAMCVMCSGKVELVGPSQPTNAEKLWNFAKSDPDFCWMFFMLKFYCLGAINWNTIQKQVNRDSLFSST